MPSDDMENANDIHPHTHSPDKSHSHAEICKIEQKFGLDHHDTEDLEYITKLVRLDNEDRRDDSHRGMAWFSLSGLIIYPMLVVFTDFIGLDKASQIIADMSGVYFASMSAIVMSLFGASAYKAKFENKENSRD